MSRIVIVGYKPKPGCVDQLAALMKTHVPRLRDEGLATDRQSIVMRAADGTFVEVFEWVSEAAMQAAHSNPNVQKMWAEYAELCDYVPVGNLPESAELFSSFSSFDA